MHQASEWFKRWLRTFVLLPDYFHALARCWQDWLWGESLVAIMFALWWFLGNPPTRYIAIYLVVAMFIAGYYIWRADHIRLMPRFEIKEFEILETPTNRSNARQIYVQVVPKCLTDAPVCECKGYLLGVYKKYIGEEVWKPTAMNEPLDLGWSIYGGSPRTLQPGIYQRLNVCFWEDSPSKIRIIIPAVEPLPARWFNVFNSTGTFRFEIRVTATSCSPVDVSVEVTLDGCEWNKPVVMLRQGIERNQA